jgi:3-oxoacyl-[acyl-carrier-protein] synthase-3
MRFNRVRIAAFGYTLPEEVVTTEEVEARLAPLYERLKLPEGRLLQMTGIRQRRFWPVGTPIAPISAASGRAALERAGIDPQHVGMLVHGSVCRDYLEPATACHVHHALGLPAACTIYDVSNACLGILNGMVLVAAMIELGHIRAGLVVGTENGCELVENTIALLNSSTELTRKSIKSSIASLTIGAASAAVVLCDEELRPSAGGRLIAATARANTAQHGLCQSEGHLTRMQTDSEQLMQMGVQTGAETFEPFLQETGWRADEIDRTFCHQVGVAHRKLLFETLRLDPAIDFATLEWLGNTGAAALPVTMAIGLERGQVRPGNRVAMLGIGSGINCLMLGAQW